MVNVFFTVVSMLINQTRHFVPLLALVADEAGEQSTMPHSVYEEGLCFSASNIDQTSTYAALYQRMVDEPSVQGLCAKAVQAV